MFERSKINPDEFLSELDPVEARTLCDALDNADKVLLRLVRDYSFIGKTQQQRQVGYDLFLSNYKIQAGSECQLLKSTVEAVNPTMRVFLDSDNLQRLNELPHLVKMSKMFVLIMSPHPLNQSNTLERFGPFGRMYCIVELITWYQNVSPCLLLCWR